MPHCGGQVLAARDCDYKLRNGFGVGKPSPVRAKTPGISGSLHWSRQGGTRTCAYLAGVRIIGITGTNGAGKGTIVAYLLERHGFAHQSVRAYLYEHLDRMGLPRDRDHLVAQANALRAERGPAALAEILYERAEASGRDTIIESIRTPGEIDALTAKGPFLLLAVDAPVQLRWQRIRDRASDTDLVDFERFCANEEREMHTEDPNKQNLRACMDRAHALLDNSGSFDDLYRQVDAVLADWPEGGA